MLHNSYPLTCSQIWIVALCYLQNLQNHTAYSHGNLAVKTLSKIVLTLRQCKHSKHEHFFE